MTLLLRRPAVFSLALFLMLFAVYVASPVKTIADTHWLLPTSVSLLTGKAGAIDVAAYDSTAYGRTLIELETVGSEKRSLFPIGTALLALPFVAPILLIDPSFTKKRIPEKMLAVIASFYGALAGVIMFWLLRERFQSLWIAGFCTFVFCFATSMWSTATRNLWQHGPLVLMLAVALLLIELARKNPALVRYAALPLAMAFVVRPVAAIPIVFLSFYVLLKYPRQFVMYALWSLPIALPWFAFNLWVYGDPLPSYYQLGRVGGSSPHISDALIGNLVSPSRGLLVFSPILLMSLTGFIVALWRERDRLLIFSFAAIVVLHWIAVSRFPHWWGGHSIGPRFMTDVLPFLIYLAGFNFIALTGLPSKARGLVFGTAVCLTIISTAIHGYASLSYHPYRWNVIPYNVDERPERLWDWSNPQFSARK